MAFEPGGMANKLGNRYEGRWVAKQLLRLLNEEIESVTVNLITVFNFNMAKQKSLAAYPAGSTSGTDCPNIGAYHWILHGGGD